MFIHAAACVRISFLLKAEWYFIVCIYHTLFIHSGNISLNAFIFFIYIHMGFVYGKNVWSYSFPSCTAAAAKSLQSCLTLCNPIDSSPPGSPVPGILQASTLEWVAISFSNAWKWKWSHLVMSDSSRPHGLQPTRLLHLWDFPGKSTGVGCHPLLCLLYWYLLISLSKIYLFEG